MQKKETERDVRKQQEVGDDLQNRKKLQTVKRKLMFASDQEQHLQMPDEYNSIVFLHQTFPLEMMER